MGERLEVGLLGATGVVGQQFVKRLATHPWFRLAWCAASARSAGQRYADATAWKLPDPIPDAVAGMRVSDPDAGSGPRIVFSALDSTVAGDIEGAFAAAGHVVISNAKNFRMEDDVPLLVPEINPDQLALIDRQRQQRRWPGAIVTNPNCSTAILVLTLAPLLPFGLRSIIVTTLQAVSGAGYPGVPVMDILGNVIPNIDGEEAKVEQEVRKILGRTSNTELAWHDVVVSAQTTRVPVPNGHTMTVSAALERPATLDEVRQAFADFRPRFHQVGLPSSPERPLQLFDEPMRPQPRLDTSLGDGMTVSVGRLRPCPVLGFKYVALGDNTVRGAAGAAILNAELMREEGRLA